LTLRRIVRSWYWLVLLCTFAGAATGFAFGMLTPPAYASTVRVLVTPPPSSSSVSMNDIQVVQALMPTYAELATSRTLLERAIEVTGIKTTADKLAPEISTHVPIGTTFLDVTVTDRDSKAAAELANEIASQLAKFELQGASDTPGVTMILTVTDPAIVSTKSTSLGSLFSAAVGAAIGFFMAVAFAFTVENLLHRNERETETVTAR